MTRVKCSVTPVLVNTDLRPLLVMVQGGRADDEDGLSRHPGGCQARCHLPRPGHAPKPAQSHDAEG